MSPNHPARIATAVLLTLGFSPYGPAQQSPAFSSKLPELLQQLSKESADPCGPPYTAQDPADAESAMFTEVEQNVAAALKPNAADVKAAHTLAERALLALEQQSAAINAGWPPENRLHYQLVDLPPILVLKLTFRTHAHFVAFAFTQGWPDTSKPQWHQVGSDDLSYEHESPGSTLSLFPLHRGPSGNARFLASFVYSGCAGSLGTEYDVREWNPHDLTHSLEQLVKQEGALSVEQSPAGHAPTAKDPFPEAGFLRTTGKLLTMPYCWFSAIDTWDYPSLCALDTYDLSRDTVLFRSRTYNRPDLVPLAKAIEFADKHDFPATRAYCASDQVAHRLVRNPMPHADDLTVTRIRRDEEYVLFSSARFHVKKQKGRWLVADYKLE